MGSVTFPFVRAFTLTGLDINFDINGRDRRRTETDEEGQIALLNWTLADTDEQDATSS